MKSLVYILSNYLWLLWFIPLALPILLPAHRTYRNVQLKNDLPFDENEIPTVILHLSDVHVNHAIPKTIENFKTAIAKIWKMNPDITLVSGDLADNFGKESLPRHGKIRNQDREAYLGIIENITKKFEVDGNHDNFGVISFESKYMYNGTYEEFLVISKSYQFGSKNYTFIGINPYSYPTSHPPLLFWSHPTKEVLDLLEKAINDVPKDNDIITFCHFPLDMTNKGDKSSSGNSYDDILTKDERVKYMITGHYHPNHFKVFHHGKKGTLEVVGTDLLKHNRYGLLSIDNGRYVYSEIDNNNDNSILGIITYPIPKNQLAYNQDTHLNDAPLRVIVYSEKSPNIYAKGAVNGIMKCEKKDQFYLCSLPMNLPSGTHKINLYGDLNKSIEFMIGDKINIIKERRLAIQFKTIANLLIFTWVIMFIIAIPINLPFLDKYYEWLLEDKDIDVSRRNSIIYWLISIFLGPIGIKSRISKLPKLLIYSLFIGVLAPLIIPLQFETVDGKLGAIWVYGFIINGKNTFSLWGLIYAFAYLITVIYSVTITMSYLSISYPLKPVGFIDLIVVIILTIISTYFTLRFGNEAGGFLGGLISPGFVFAPIYYYILMIIWRIKHKENIISTKIDNSYLL